MALKVALFYPIESIGGAEILFSRVAEYLSTRGIEITNFDFGNSFITRYLEEHNISFNHVVIDKSLYHKTFISEDYTFIVTPSYLFILKEYFHFNKNSKFIFWELHPDNILDHTIFSYVHKRVHLKYLSKTLKFIELSRIRKIKKFLTNAHNKNGLLFMCRRNFITNSVFFDLDIKAKYLPIPQPIFEAYPKQLKSHNSINIAWLSRLSEDKVNILNLLIEDLERYKIGSAKYNINLHIIGNGAFSEKVSESNKLNIIKAGVLAGNELTEYLNNKVDLGFAMGTSALEFASRSIPTVLVPSTTLNNFYSKTPNKYIWLYTIEGFDIATEVFHQNQASSIAEILQEIEFNSLQYFSNLTYDYVLDFHSIEKVGDSLTKSISNSDLSFQDIKDSKIYDFSLLEYILIKIKRASRSIVRSSSTLS